VRVCQVMRALGWHWSGAGMCGRTPRSVQIRRRKMTLQHGRGGLKGCRCVAVVFVAMDKCVLECGGMELLWAVSGPAPDSPNQVVMRCDVDGKVGHSTPGATESGMQEAEVMQTTAGWQWPSECAEANLLCNNCPFL
jgi:hypothetical protein